MPNALYHVRLVATNSAGTTFGPDVTFTTKKDPPPNAPNARQVLRCAADKGRVLIKFNGKFVPLTELRQIPAGTMINALHGTLSLTTARLSTPAAEKSKSKKRRPRPRPATFGGAVFKVTQDRTPGSPPCR